VFAFHGEADRIPGHTQGEEVMMFPLIWIHALTVSTFGSHWTVAIVALLIGLLAKTPRRSQARARFSVARAASLKLTLAFSLLLAPLTATAGGPLSSGTTAVDGSTNFAVATIKPSLPGAEGNAFRVRGRRFESTNTSLSELIAFAYDLYIGQITAAPAWVETDKYDLTGQPGGEGQPTEKEWREMVRHLIEERFKLTVHYDKKQLSVYVLSVARMSPKLTKSGADPNGLPAISLELGAITATNANMQDLAGVMQRAVLDRPVIDQTKFRGRYDFTLNWTPDQSQFGGVGAGTAPATNNANAPPSLATAMREQLGLKLDATKAPVHVLVIDHVERPSDN
jgi:uncharacterized protein (TIGR03435 family)